MPMRVRAVTVLALAGCLLSALDARSQGKHDWITPLPPFRIADGLFYVGSRDLAAYLVATPAGEILINANLPDSAPAILHSIEQLGFQPHDVKILLISHAHSDHAGGAAASLRATGARYEVMAGDVPVVESGGRADFAYGSHDHYPPAHVDRVLHDGDTVSLGGTTLTAHLTAGHTRGSTTWTMRVHVPGEPAAARRSVVIVSSWNVLPGYRLVGSGGRSPSYPGIADDYAAMFTTLQALPCDIFLGAHGSFFDLLGKFARMRSEGDRVWIDPEGYRQAISSHEQSFRRELERQTAKAGR